MISTGGEEAEVETKVDKNLVILRRPEEFSKGKLDALDQNANEGEPYSRLTLTEGADEGVFISQVFRTEAWNDCVASWVADTPKGTSIEVYVSAYIPECDDGSDGGWTNWISWGEWSPWIRRNCPDDKGGIPRQDGKKGGKAYSFTFKGAGDSSMNTERNFAARAFQIKAVLRRRANAEFIGEASGLSPILYMLAVTFKNTFSEEWQDTEKWEEAAALTLPEIKEPKSIKLNTPAISQITRDPDYKGSICSATCMTMLLGGKGENLLPEEVVMTNYDYGFGGNGNWSFTSAIGGAFGYESFVHYGSFRSLRQEIAHGNACELSVRYSKEKDGDYPYLENAPCNTGGHLITITGYRFDEEKNEYIYLSNDPAGEGDEEVLRREYRESELNKVWGRRAMNILHQKIEGAGEYAHKRFSGNAEKKEDGSYALILEDGSLLRPSENFREKPRENFGSAGSIFVNIPGEEYNLPDDVIRVEANHKAFYEGIEISSEGSLRFSGELGEKIGTGSKIYLIDNHGNSYMFIV